MIFTSLLVSLAACAGVSEKDVAFEAQRLQPTTETGMWTWVAGDSKTDQRGVYGTQGIAAATNKPGGRSDAVSWIDSEDNLWLFGGRGFADKGLSQYLNDLWKFDGTNWTWVSGDNTGSEHGAYGPRGVAGSTNRPGGRKGAVSWIDPQGNLWLFGGEGYAGKGFMGFLNDLWKFDGMMWTWVSGDKKIDQEGEYGDQGVAADTNTPGARYDAVGWTDAEGNLWLFGGFGCDRYGAEGYLNDLWKFDGSTWMWVAGDNTRNEIGDYGAMGVAEDTNKPGARSLPVPWADTDGALWLFGGHGLANVSWEPKINLLDDRPKGAGFLNDLWKFDGTSWIWVSGESKAFYNPQVDYDEMKEPPARFGAVGWSDAAGNLWLFGGNARVRFSNVTNDIWKFDGTKWIRVYGAFSRKDRDGVYGTKGVAADTNRPEARFGAVSWTDNQGGLWLFGGRKPLSRNNSEYFNDLWKFEP
jgi:hypothetical protein